ncbi:MAG TPA: ABC transporter permease [Acidimicrobiales bacterium]|nr:ABC transporter permease [Acidimicrobiales bacterium]
MIGVRVRDVRADDVRVALHQVGYEQKAYWRNPMAAIFTFAFPIIFLIVVGTSAGPVKVPGYTLRYDQYVVVAMLTFGLIAACYTNLAMAICTRRETGVLKRMRGTPIAIGSYLAGLIGSVLIVVAILTVIVVAIGMAFYHLHFPFHPGAAVLTLVVGIVTFCSLGLAVTVLVPNADAAPAVVNGLYFPVVFISGVFYPLAQGSVLARIADVFPIFHMIRAVVSAFEGGPGSGLRVGDLAVMLAWAVGALFVTARRFRWEPRRPKA